MDAELVQVTALKKDLTSEERMQFDAQYSTMQKNPTTALILSILLGFAGVDRFYVGDTGLGIGKVVFSFVCFILLGWLIIPLFFPAVWIIIDWFLIMGAARKATLKKAQDLHDSLVSMRPADTTAKAAEAAAPAEEAAE